MLEENVKDECTRRLLYRLVILASNGDGERVSRSQCLTVLVGPFLPSPPPILAPPLDAALGSPVELGPPQNCRGTQTAESPTAKFANTTRS